MLNRELALRLIEEGHLGPDAVPSGAPDRFGRYRLVRLLGEGGSGQVYLAHDPEIGREVAVKILERASPHSVERFRREMGILALLRHPGIVSIYDTGMEEGRPFYAMEFVGERSLATAGLSLHAFVPILEKVARACHAAHEAGIVHRDLKPANILLREEGDPVVADFGIAKKPDTTLTETGQALGTPSYMSPEQARGEDADARTDVYSLGVMLYEALAGRRPFQGRNLPEIAQRIQKETPAPPRKWNPKAPRALETIALKAMTREPGKRYATALALAEDLRAWKEGRPIQARPPGLCFRAYLALKRRRRLLGTALLPMAAGLVLFLALRPTPPPDRSKLDAAWKVVEEERVAIEAWKPNLYLPPREIPYQRLERSMNELGRVLTLPDLPADLRYRAWFSRAEAAQFLGQTDEALRGLEEAIAAGAAGEAYLRRAMIRWDRGVREWILESRAPTALLAEIAGDFRDALRSGFRDGWYRRIAEALLPVTQKPTRESAEEARRALATLGEADRPTEEVEKLQGDLLLLARRSEEAEKHYRKAILNRRSYAQAYNGLALAYLIRWEEKDNDRKAIGEALLAIQINPRFDDAYRLFTRMLRERLSWYFLRSLKSPVAEDEALLEQSLERLRAAERLLPDFLPIRAALGSAYVLRGYSLAGSGEDPTPAIAEGTRLLKQTLERDAANVEAWLALGMAHGLKAFHRKERTGADLDRAAECLDRAAKLAPDRTGVSLWIGFHRYWTGDYPAALEAWNRVIRRKPHFQSRLDRYIRRAEESR